MRPPPSRHGCIALPVAMDKGVCLVSVLGVPEHALRRQVFENIAYQAPATDSPAAPCGSPPTQNHWAHLITTGLQYDCTRPPANRGTRLFRALAFSWHADR
jgi:hypothetical protein